MNHRLWDLDGGGSLTIMNFYASKVNKKYKPNKCGMESYPFPSLNGTESKQHFRKPK